MGPTYVRHIYRPAALLLILLTAALVWQYESVHIVPVRCAGMGDCVKYEAMTRAFIDARKQVIESPFNVRILTPFLAASLKGLSPLQGFSLINAASLCILLISWFATARHLKIHPIFFLAGVGWFLLHPLGFKLYHAVPVSPDPLAHAAMALCAYLFVSKRRLLFWLMICVGILIKESFFFLAVTACLAEVIGKRDENEPMSRTAQTLTCFVVVLLFARLSSKLIMQYQFPTDRELTATEIMQWWGHEALKDPNRLVVWIAAVFCAMGVFPALASTWRGSVATLWRDRVWLFLFLSTGGYVIFGLLAGSDMSRIIFNGASVFLLLAFLPSGITTPQACVISALSLASALIYSQFLPGAIEYHYYDNHQHIGDLAAFVAIHAAACALLYAWIHPANAKGSPSHLTH